MAVNDYGGKLTIAATAKSLVTLIREGPDPTFTTPRRAQALTLRAAPAATHTGTTYIHRVSTGTVNGVTSLGYLEAKDSFTWSLVGPLDLDNIFLIGTAGDIVYLWGVEY